MAMAISNREMKWKQRKNQLVVNNLFEFKRKRKQTIRLLFNIHPFFFFLPVFVPVS